MKTKITFENCKSYGEYGINIFNGESIIYQCEDYKNAQVKQKIMIPNRVLVEFAKFYLKYKGYNA